MRKGSLRCITNAFPEVYPHLGVWKPIPEVAPSVPSSFWTDGTKQYVSDGNVTYRKDGDTWKEISWSDRTIRGGEYIWTDGKKIYHSYMDEQYTYSNGGWLRGGMPNGTYGDDIWSDGTNIYQSSYQTYKLSGTSWSTRVWAGTTLQARDMWSDGTHIYSSASTNLASDSYLVLNGNVWESKKWNDGIIIRGHSIWSDGTNIYHGVSHVLNGDTWEEKAWNIQDAGEVWSDGTKIYLSTSNGDYVLAQESDIDPVPQLNPAALMNGFFVGQAIKRNR